MSDEKQNYPRNGEGVAPFSPHHDDDDDKYSYLEAYIKGEVFGHYADFSGRTGRRDFWLTVLCITIFNMGVMGVCGIISYFNLTTGVILFGLWGLILLIPQLSLGVRRLRDAGHHPAWILLPLVPLAGPIVLIVFWCQASKDAEDAEYYNSKFSFGVDLTWMLGSVILYIIGFWMMVSALMVWLHDVLGLDYREEYIIEASDYNYNEPYVEETTAVEDSVMEFVDKPYPGSDTDDGNSGSYKGATNYDNADDSDDYDPADDDELDEDVLNYILGIYG